MLRTAGEKSVKSAQSVQYAQDGDPGALISALRVIARVNGITALAEEVCMTRQSLQKALSAKGNPRLVFLPIPRNENSKTKTKISC
jgi:probable addiction module antidote protein